MPPEKRNTKFNPIEEEIEKIKEENIRAEGELLEIKEKIKEKNSRLEGELLEIKEKNSELKRFFLEIKEENSNFKKTKEDIKKEIEDIKKVKTTIERSILIATGFFFLIGAELIGINLLIRPAIERIYPPEFIYAKNQDNIRVDELPRIQEEAPELVWNSIEKWEDARFTKFIKKAAVAKTIKEEFIKDIEKNLDYIKDKNKLSAEDIEGIGKLPIPATITMIGETQKNTNCHHQVDNKQKVAIIALPNDIDESYFIAYGCNHRYPNKIFIRILEEDGKASLVEEVRIIGLEKNPPGKHPGRLEVRVSLKVANQMGLPNAEKFKAFLPRAEVSISNVSEF